MNLKRVSSRKWKLHSKSKKKLKRKIVWVMVLYPHTLKWKVKTLRALVVINLTNSNRISQARKLIRKIFKKWARVRSSINSIRDLWKTKIVKSFLVRVKIAYHKFNQLHSTVPIHLSVLIQRLTEKEESLYRIISLSLQ